MRKSFWISLMMILLGISCKKQQMSSQPPVTQSPAIDTVAAAIIDVSTVQQKIAGFGGADIIEWTGDLTADQRITAFSPSAGIGLSIVRVRVPVDPSKFSQAKATIDACKSYGGRAIATAWSAPVSMKTNGNIVGGKLKKTAYADFASYLKDFNTAVGGLTAISPANEPNYLVDYESMEMTAAEVADFVAAEGDHCGAPMMAPEPFNMDPTYIGDYLANATAKSKTGIICGHIYGATPESLSVDKPVWMTEHYTNSEVSGNDWSNALKAAKEIHDCMNAGWSAYVWWYIRRSYGPMDENGNIQKLGYVMAQYARYVRPGYSKIFCTANPSGGIYATAYRQGAKIVVVIINQNSAEIYLPIDLSETVSGFHQYQTTGASDLTAYNVSVSAGGFGVNLPGQSITTLVSD